MKLTILDAEKNKKGEKELPVQFQESFRPDLIKRAVLAVQSAGRHRYGSYLLAGMRHSSRVSKRRRDWKGCYGFGVSRVDRKVLSHRGTRMNWVGSTTPQTRGGRRSHPPKSEKILLQKINDIERRKAIRSAMAATLDRKIVSVRGHFPPETYPFIIDASLENMEKTSKVKEALLKLGFAAELARAEEKKVRAGRGKSRGRKYKQKKSLLVVVSGDCPLLHSAKNISGLDIVEAKALNAELLAPGTRPGRVTLWTEKAIEVIAKDKLFQ